MVKTTIPAKNRDKTYIIQFFWTGAIHAFAPFSEIIRVGSKQVKFHLWKVTKSSKNFSVNSSWEFHWIVMFQKDAVCTGCGEFENKVGRTKFICLFQTSWDSFLLVFLFKIWLISCQFVQQLWFWLFSF